jgi:hypothetical protein
LRSGGRRQGGSRLVGREERRRFGCISGRSGGRATGCGASGGVGRCRYIVEQAHNRCNNLVGLYGLLAEKGLGERGRRWEDRQAVFSKHRIDRCKIELCCCGDAGKPLAHLLGNDPIGRSAKPAGGNTDNSDRTDRQHAKQAANAAPALSGAHVPVRYRPTGLVVGAHRSTFTDALRGNLQSKIRNLQCYYAAGAGCTGWVSRARRTCSRSW